LVFGCSKNRVSLPATASNNAPEIQETPTKEIADKAEKGTLPEFDVAPLIVQAKAKFWQAWEWTKANRYAVGTALYVLILAAVFYKYASETPEIPAPKKQEQWEIDLDTYNRQKTQAHRIRKEKRIAKRNQQIEEIKARPEAVLQGVKLLKKEVKKLDEAAVLHENIENELFAKVEELTVQKQKSDTLLDFYQQDNENKNQSLQEAQDKNLVLQTEIEDKTKAVNFFQNKVRELENAKKPAHELVTNNFDIADVPPETLVS
jgi:hypothetical protein